MDNPRQALPDGPVPSPDTTPINRRSQPRASHACQMCRLKKARCNQEDPCSYCQKRSFRCVYMTKGISRTGSTGSHDIESSRGTHKRTSAQGSPDLVHKPSSQQVPEYQLQPRDRFDATGVNSGAQVIDQPRSLERSPFSQEDRGQHVRNGTRYLSCTYWQSQQLI